MLYYPRFLIRALFIFSGLLLCHCTTTPDPEKETLNLPKSPIGRRYVKRPRTYNNINTMELMDELGVSKNWRNLGYYEKPFNACQVKANKSPNPSCEDLYLGVVNFHVMCRDSTGTVEKVNLFPLHSTDIRWKRGTHKGRTVTDKDGFGSVQFITRNSSRNASMYLYLGRKVARKQFKDYWKLILPMSWCNHH
ncbi:MAG: hypothetical protein KDD33_04375 [Bdellovibrionales bacterium]|nr:hypothetical protein [Bdellovibrionales bacterium]